MKGMQATDVMSGQKPLRKPHSGWGEQSKPATYLPSAKDEGWRQPEHRESQSSAGWEI